MRKILFSLISILVVMLIIGQGFALYQIPQIKKIVAPLFSSDDSVNVGDLSADGRSPLQEQAVNPPAPQNLQPSLHRVPPEDYSFVGSAIHSTNAKIKKIAGNVVWLSDNTEINSVTVTPQTTLAFQIKPKDSQALRAEIKTHNDHVFELLKDIPQNRQELLHEISPNPFILKNVSLDKFKPGDQLYLAYTLKQDNSAEAVQLYKLTNKM